MTSDFFRRNPLNLSGLGPVLVLLSLMKRSTRRVDSATTAVGMDGLSTTAIAGKMTDDMEGWSEEKRDLIAKEPAGGEFPNWADSGGFCRILFSYYKNVTELAESAIK
jgi:hypothetical protein